VTDRRKEIFRTTAWLIVVAAAIGFAAYRLTHRRGTGEEDAKVWFYDQRAHKLYATAQDTIPPDETVGDEVTPGVRAVVVTFPGQENDPSRRRIAYLESYSPELKLMLEKKRQAIAAGKPFDGKQPSRYGGYYDTNTLVRRPDDAEWETEGTPEGREIMTEWRSWRGPDGQRPIISVPN
jgi:hypothetical protein